MSAAPIDAVPASRFRLMRYFTLTTLGAFVAAGVALVLLQYGEEEYFEQSQRKQHALFAQSQAELSQQNEEAARASLLSLHETSHVTLTGVVANLLWANDIAPFVIRAQQVPVSACRDLPRGTDEAAGRERKACFADAGRRIRALPGFAALDLKARSAMRSTNVFKVKVWDMRGVTVYSSEHAQVGDDGAANKGWQAAVAGQAASELTHRDRFSAFEGMVENRDLISSYVPVRDDPAGPVVAVFELYSDVTPFMAQSRAATRRFISIARANEDQVMKASLERRETLRDNSKEFLLVVGGLLALLYAVSLVIVRIGQRIIDRQFRAQERSAQREALWHQEKMAALGAMANNVAHEVGNPLAVIHGLAEELPDRASSQRFLEQTDRIAGMMRQISTFASARSGAPEWVDINAMVKAVCDFQTFDRRFAAVPMAFTAGANLPARELVPDHLNEALMALLQGCAKRSLSAKPPLAIAVRTLVRGDDVVIRIECPGLGPASPHDRSQDTHELTVALGRIPSMGGQLVRQDGALEIVLPPPWGKT